MPENFEYELSTCSDCHELYCICDDDWYPADTDNDEDYRCDFCGRITCVCGADEEEYSGLYQSPSCYICGCDMPNGFDFPLVCEVCKDKPEEPANDLNELLPF